jgi:hypothetical protein
MSDVRPPCRSCPWVKANRAQDIPNFRLDLAEQLAACQSGEFGAPIFACHLSKPGAEFTCAGWLAVHGRESIGVRIMAMHGHLPIEALAPGVDWPELHADYAEMMAKLRS